MLKQTAPSYEENKHLMEENRLLQEKAARLAKELDGEPL
jgi:hypothetical protein